MKLSIWQFIHVVDALNILITGGAGYVGSHVCRAVLERYQPAAVMHFAAFAYVGKSVEKPLLYYHNNVAGSMSHCWKRSSSLSLCP